LRRNDDEQEIRSSVGDRCYQCNRSRGWNEESGRGWSGNVSQQEHYSECGEFRRPHYAGGGGESGRVGGPFTVFAPTNEAFAMLPAGTVDTLLKPENKATLTKVLTYHVVSGRLSATDLKKQIKAGNGTAELTTVEGGKLWATMHDGGIMLKDEKGDTAMVTIPNVFQSNGVIQVIDRVLMPN
jgi:hypothetical protein